MTEDDGGGCQALTTWVMEVLTLQRDAELSDEISGLGCVDGVGGGGVKDTRTCGDTTRQNKKKLKKRCEVPPTNRAAGHTCVCAPHHVGRVA